MAELGVGTAALGLGTVPGPFRLGPFGVGTPLGVGIAWGLTAAGAVEPEPLTGLAMVALA